MYEDIDFIEEDGKIATNELTVFALSTCGFCRRGLNFLRENEVKFRYVYVDKIDIEKKSKIKESLKKKFNRRVAFPFLVCNDEKAIVGFVKSDWEEICGL
ncbi:glutaredoxin family protein [Promethearchaeum syntrophicum]|uniref:Glutaredoxin family protein n=1 Tax=Promethearchaeum syntrophicum TaxID=2594042 RepID=A0A5B9D8F0_9ARCH|nr:glutaredoxin domain-containing protein [Candidatus Prometheoarchaeum syntrophicum]QEE15305.1 Glutaredoxin [Candidatus Prometheoarchaeum syntrophicum]